MPKETCPVCEMEIDRESAEAQSTYSGKTYYFCSDGCKDQWDANPEEYAEAEQTA